MIKLTQGQYVESELRINGSITRNKCLKEYITRLSAIICDMNKKGYVIEANRIPTTTRWGKGFDYEYKVVHKPSKSIYYE